MQLPAACNMLLISYIVKPTFSVFIHAPKHAAILNNSLAVALLV